MPVYLGSGSHEHSGKKYRFLVIEKFGEDIDKLWHTNNKSFPTATVFLIALQMVLLITLFFAVFIFFLSLRHLFYNTSIAQGMSMLI